MTHTESEDMTRSLAAPSPVSTWDTVWFTPPGVDTGGEDAETKGALGENKENITCRRPCLEGQERRCDQMLCS